MAFEDHAENARARVRADHGAAPAHFYAATEFCLQHVGHFFCKFGRVALGDIHFLHVGRTLFYFVYDIFERFAVAFGLVHHVQPTRFVEGENGLDLE